jgi:hypothetical protein
MAKKATKKAAAADTKGFSTEEVTKAIDSALEGLRAERKRRSRRWTVGQHLQAAACETALVLARKHCSCSSSSHSFPTANFGEDRFLNGLLKG